MTQGLLIEVPAHNGNTDENQRFTIRRAVAWALRVVGIVAFTLDVAACEESHHASLFYDGARRGNGLREEWFGDVFCNPPWDDVESWVLRAWEAFVFCPRLQSVTMLVPGDRTHRPWWVRYVEPYRDGRGGGPVGNRLATLTTHFAPERFPYGGPGNPLGIGCAEPNFTSVLLVWRRA